eukprot:scaffold5108_cov172-Amphora_coffeaeformis.AAC.8
MAKRLFLPDADPGNASIVIIGSKERCCGLCPSFSPRHRRAALPVRVFEARPALGPYYYGGAHDPGCEKSWSVLRFFVFEF